MTSRRTLLFAAVLTIPAVLLGIWLVLSFGGSIERTAADESRRAELALADYAVEFWKALPGVAVGVEPSLQELPAATGAARIGIELEAAGAVDDALSFLRRAPTTQRVRLALARGHLALGDSAEVLELLENWPHENHAIDGVPTALTAALLRARAGETQLAWRQVLGGELVVPTALAALVVEQLVDLAPAPRSREVAEFLWIAAARRQVRSGMVTIPESTPVPLSQGGLLTATGRLLSPAAIASAHVAVSEVITARTGMRVQASGGDHEPLAETVLAGTDLVVLSAIPLASERLQSIALTCLVLALVTFLAGHVGLLLLTRKSAALSRLKSEFIDVVSHELRTPLTALAVKAEMLAGGDVPAAKVADYQRGLERDVFRLTKLVETVLDFGRLERGRYRFDPQRIAVRRVIATAVRASRDALRLGGQVLRLEVPRQLPDVRVDLEMFSLALRNLIDNATKHAPGSSGIELAAEAVGAKLRLSVRDRGPGLGALDGRLLFEPFRAGGKAGGSGLGLAIVDRCVRAHGGTVTALSRPDGGSEFCIEIPSLEAGR